MHKVEPVSPVEQRFYVYVMPITLVPVVMSVLATQMSVPMVELVCLLPLQTTVVLVAMAIGLELIVTPQPAKRPLVTMPPLLPVPRRQQAHCVIVCTDTKVPLV